MLITVVIVNCMIAHFFADFLMQSREMGKKKSEDFSWLMKHLKINFMMFFLVLTSSMFIWHFKNPFSWYIVLGVSAFKAFMFSLWNTVIHGIIDWNIWRLYKALVQERILLKKDTHLLTGDKDTPWRFWEDRIFYDFIGLDQLLHMLTIVVLAYIIFT